MDVQTQLDMFRAAVDLVGGIKPAAKALEISERNVHRILSGENRLHTGLLDRIAKALLDHAQACRTLERALSPAYAANLTEAQAKPPKHDGNSKQRAPKASPEQVAEWSQRLGLTTP